MLQKGFFMTESFNPSPFWDNTIVNLSGAAMFEEDTVFPAGRYSVDVQAGGGGDNTYNDFGKPGLISTTVIVEQPFIVRAYCGSRGTSSSAGTNLYSGEFKVNAYMVASNVPAVSHIFGNSGSSQYGPANSWPTSGNSLGNGAYNSNMSRGTGAGSCLHFLPVGGVFGTDYLRAFQVTAASTGNAGSGSAYGGAGSGAGSQSSIFGGHIRMSSYNAGSTPYGTGGAGVSAPNYDGTIPGNNGTGIGYGNGGTGVGANGAGAWFDGTIWHDSRTTGATATADGHIIVKYIGTIN